MAIGPDFPRRSTGRGTSDPLQQELEESFLVRFEADLRIGRALAGPGKALLVDIKMEGRGRAQLGANRIGHGYRVKECRGGRMALRTCHPLVVKQRQLVSERRAVGEDLLALRRLRWIWVESSGIMKTGTPAASRALAPAGSRLMFHSASGGRRSPFWPS